MVLKTDQQRVRELLKETITLLCKNGLNYKSQFSVEALIGITLDQDDVFLVSIKETVKDGLQAAKQEIESAEPDTCMVSSPASSESVPSSDRRHSVSRSRESRPSSRSSSKHSSSVGEKRRFQGTDDSWRRNPEYPSAKRSHQSSSSHSEHYGSTDMSRTDNDDIVVIKEEATSDPELEEAVEMGNKFDIQAPDFGDLSLPGVVGKAEDGSGSLVPSYGPEVFAVPGCSSWGSGAPPSDAAMMGDASGAGVETSGSQSSSPMLPSGDTRRNLTPSQYKEMLSNLPDYHSPHQCPICGNTLGNRQILVDHIDHVHRKRKHACQICSKVYASRGSLHNHVKTHGIGALSDK